MFTTIKIKDTEYKLSISCSQTKELNDKVGNIYEIFADMAVEEGEKQKMPPIHTMIDIVALSFKRFNHKITDEKAYSLLDAYVEENPNGMVSLIELAVEVLQASGFIPAAVEEKTE